MGQKGKLKALAAERDVTVHALVIGALIASGSERGAAKLLNVHPHTIRNWRKRNAVSLHHNDTLSILQGETK